MKYHDHGDGSFSKVTSSGLVPITDPDEIYRLSIIAQHQEEPIRCNGCGKYICVCNFITPYNDSDGCNTGTWRDMESDRVVRTKQY